MGEGSIPRLKQRIHHMKKGFAFNALKSLYSKNSIVNMIEHSIDNINTECGDDSRGTALRNLIEAAESIAFDGDKTIEDEKEGKKNRILDCEDIPVGFVRQSRGEVLRDPITTSKHIIEIVVNNTTHEMYLFDNGPDQMFVQILVDTAELPITVCGAAYFPVKSSLTKTKLVDFRKESRVCGLLLRHKHKQAYYHAITMDWKELVPLPTGVNEFVLPRCPGFSY